jgi:hypothetical protein
MKSHLKYDTLAYHLYQYLIKNEGWHSKGSLYQISEREEYSPETCGRTLRTMSEDGIIQCEYYKGKRKQKLAKYSALPVVQKVLIPTIIIREDGTRAVRI